MGARSGFWLRSSQVVEVKVNPSYFFMLSPNVKKRRCSKTLRIWEKLKVILTLLFILRRQNDSSVKRKKSELMLQCINWSQGSARSSSQHFQHLTTVQSYFLWLTKDYVSRRITLLTSALSTGVYSDCCLFSTSPSPLWNFKYKIFN